MRGSALRTNRAAKRSTAQSAAAHPTRTAHADAAIAGPYAPEELLGQAGEAGRVALLTQLQRTYGNTQVQRLVSARLGQMAGASLRPAATHYVQRFEAGEHAQLGAKAGETEKKFTVNEVEFTYGEIIAMGDLFKNPDDFRKASKTELEALRTLIRRERDKGIGSVSEQDWIDAAGQRYLDLAAKNIGHFAPANPAAGFAEGEGDNKSTWYMYHNRALALAQQKKMDQAFITNAFGDHFLTDAFSAGHLINKDSVVATAKKNLTDPKKFETGIATAVLKDATGAKLFQYEANPGAMSSWTAMSIGSLADVMDRVRYWEGDMFYSNFAKAVHDKLNQDILPGGKGGVEVENNRKDKWHLAGDKTLSSSPETIRIAREAVAQSRKNIEDAEGQAKVDNAKLAQSVWDYVPHPSVAGQKQVDDATKTYTDPNQPETVEMWAKITIDNLDAVLSKLLEKGLLRFKKNKDVSLESDDRIARLNAYGGARLAVLKMKTGGKAPEFQRWVPEAVRGTAETMGNAQPRGIQDVDPKTISGHLPAPVEDVVVKMNAYGRWRFAVVTTGEKWVFKEWIPSAGEGEAAVRAKSQVVGVLEWDQGDIAGHLAGGLHAPVEDVVVKMNAYGRWRFAVITTGDTWHFKEWIPKEGESGAAEKAKSQPGGMQEWDQGEIAKHMAGPLPAPPADKAPAPAPQGR
jgi:hypothetical protein